MLLAPFSVAYTGGLLNGPVTTFATHPITTGLTSVTFNGGYVSQKSAFPAPRYAFGAFNFDGHFGIGLGSLLMLANVILLSGYSASCHSLRYLVGGHLDSFHGKSLRFRKAVLATGARAARPDIPGLAEVGYFTNETVFSLTELPRRLGSERRPDHLIELLYSAQERLMEQSVGARRPARIIPLFRSRRA